MQVLPQRVGTEGGHRILDVGSRDAKELTAIATRVGPRGVRCRHHVALQYVESACDEFAQPFLRHVTVGRGHVVDVPFDDRTFDVILCEGVLHEVRRIGRALEETALVCIRTAMRCIVDVQRSSEFRFEAYR